jgi:hypothetical protein
MGGIHRLITTTTNPAKGHRPVTIQFIGALTIVIERIKYV